MSIGSSSETRGKSDGDDPEKAGALATPIVTRELMISI